MTLAEQVKAAGVVGAGGGGFPTHVKIGSKADTVIANGAECEPLLHKDAAVMEHFSAGVVRGVELIMEAVGASRGFVALKEKNHEAVEAVEKACKGTAVQVKLLGDYYPAGDEYELVHEVTGRLIPPAGIPLNVGVVVNNVETLVNVTAAANGRPVTHKILTIAGAVKTPVTLSVPLGTTLRDCIEAAGGAQVGDPILCIGGMMMGETSDDLETPVTKTTTGAIVLPRSHRVVERKLTPPKAQAGIGKSACDQCRYCTEYCPRYLLGYPVEPHQVMRSLAFTATGKDHWNQWASLCCSCGLCTLFACPEALFPKEACDDAKAEMRAAGVKWSGPMTVKEHPMHDGRRVPIKTLVKRLNLQAYDHPAPLRPEPLKPDRVVLRLKQSAGSAAQTRLKAGARVTGGQVVAEPAPNAMGAFLHAPFGAQVESVTDCHLTLARLA
jgi:Na+-translocating ferredoxin:NAD+ oxidoreductase RnfC subunit